MHTHGGKNCTPPLGAGNKRRPKLAPVGLNLFPNHILPSRDLINGLLTHSKTSVVFELTILRPATPQIDPIETSFAQAPNSSPCQNLLPPHISPRLPPSLLMNSSSPEVKMSSTPLAFPPDHQFLSENLVEINFIEVVNFIVAGSHSLPWACWRHICTRTRPGRAGESAGLPGGILELTSLIFMACSSLPCTLLGLDLPFLLRYMSTQSMNVSSNAYLALFSPAATAHT